MNFRWSALNIVSVGLVIVVVVARAFRKVLPTAVTIGLLSTCGLALIALIVIGAINRRKGRVVEKFAKESGLAYHSVLTGHPFHLTTFPFGQGGKEATADMVLGKWGEVPVYACVIQAEKGHGRTRRVKQYQVIAIRMVRGLPTVQLIPLDTVATAAVMVGGQKIDFESAEFNQNWRVMGKEARSVHDIVHPRLMERLNLPSAVGRPIVIEQDIIFTWSAVRRPPSEFFTEWRLLADVYESVPNVVWEDRSFVVSQGEG